jgi:hypothetical protein
MNTFTEQQILSELRALDPFSQQELLDFLAFLRYRQQPPLKPAAPATNAFEIYARLNLGAGGDAYCSSAQAKQGIRELLQRKRKASS